MNRQAALFPGDVALTTDMHVLLQLFTNYRGIDRPEDFHGLSHVYHSVYTQPDKLPKSSWSEARVLKAIEDCEQAGLITYDKHDTGHKWTITDRGLEARHAAFRFDQQKARKTK